MVRCTNTNHGAILSSQNKKSSVAALTLAAVGIVYGDIGTSPLYTLRAIFDEKHGLPLTTPNILGIISLIFWALTVIVSLKYVTLVLRADNRGEGGIIALMALATNSVTKHSRWHFPLLVIGVLGATMFYGDSVITPAISVLGAIEGLEVAAPGMSHYVVPLAVVVLVLLYSVQSHGTAGIGRFFGPVMLVWFITLAIMGVINIIEAPVILQALNPYYALSFMLDNKFLAFVALGAVVLAITGAEALYADMGHFGRKPIARAWFVLVLPALTLNYFGQGALLLDNPEAARNPFYLLAPSWALLPLVALSTLATIIASQAVITGAFSLTRQAIQLGYVPRMHIQHTSSAEQGQIYIGTVNWALMVGVVLLVIGFGSSGALASAYGVAVTATMWIDTLLVSAIMLLMWKTPRWLAIPLLLVFLLVDSLFLAANLPKIVQGGAFPVLAGIALFILMTTWKRGRQILVERLDEGALPLPLFIASIRSQPPHRVQGTSVFLTARSDAVPHALLHNLLHNQVLHEQVVLLTVVHEDEPRVAAERRFEVTAHGEGFFRVVLHFGFVDEPDVPAALALCHLEGLDFSPMRTTYFLSRETVIPTKRIGMARWREALFAFLLKNANGNLRYFKPPVNRVIELGTQVEI